MVVARWIMLSALALAAVQPAIAQTSPAAGSGPADIVVIAQRSGVPVWKVIGPRSTLVLVGSIGRVSPGTQWDPTALDAALTRADQIIFPDAWNISLGLFSAIGLLGKWRAQASLPKGQTLQAITTPAQWARLVALRHRGLLKKGFERSHPYHLAVSLNGMVRDKRKMAPGVDTYVRRFLSKNRDKEVPVVKDSLKQVTAAFFASDPREHVACLMSMVAMVEAGETGVRMRAAARDKRSQAWAQRHVPAAVAARTEDGWQSCWPKGSRIEQAREARLSPLMQDLLRRPDATLAVVPLDSLAKPGGVLDKLSAAGFDVQGPTWKPDA